VCKGNEPKIDAVSPEDKGSLFNSTYSSLGTLPSEYEEAFLGACSDLGKSKRKDGPWRVPITIGKGEAVFKVDSGADVTLINYKTYLDLDKKGEVSALETMAIALDSPASHVSVKGKLKLNLQYKNNTLVEEGFVMAKNKSTDNLLSRQASVRLGLIRFVGKVNVKESLFGFGTWDTGEVDLCLNQGVVPYSVRGARSVAIPLREAAEKLQSLEDQGVIEKVTHPTSWLSPMVPVIKPCSNPVEVRICCDYKFLNQHLQREVYEIPTFEELVSQLSGAVKFSKLDAKSGFYQIPLSESSRDLTTFITPFGRYRYRRLPMGINVAPEIFQRKMVDLLTGLPGVICYLDDILVFGLTDEEHDDNLNRVLERILASGLKLNKKKCIFDQPQINFLGHLLSVEGI